MCVSYSHKWGAQRQNFYGPAPWGPGEGSKYQILFNFNYKVNIKDFYSKLCVCSHKERIHNISDRFSILSPGSCPRGGTWGYLGAKIKFCPAVCELCYLLINHWTKFNQIWCVSYSHKRSTQRQILFWPRPWGPGEGSNVKYHLISITKSTSKIFIPNFVCVLINERYKTYQMGFLFCRLGHAQGVGFWGMGQFFFQTWSCGISNRGGDKQNRMQVTFSS